MTITTLGINIRSFVEKSILEYFGNIYVKYKKLLAIMLAAT